MANKTKKSRKIPVTNPNIEIPKYLDDAQAERIGTALVQDLGLTPHRNDDGQVVGWQTAGGWVTNKGIARRIHWAILQGV